MLAEHDTPTIKETENALLESIYSTNSSQPFVHVEWTPQHEKILIDWADKATCYKWLHEKTQREFSRKNRWFTIPVIIMSTITGTANFAQNNIPANYLTLATMVIGSVNLFAGILTTIQQFLKISELNESHRVSSISWGKFHRNIKIELAKAPAERSHVTQLIKASKEEFDRLIETSETIPNHVVALFNSTFSGGEIKYDSAGNKYPLTEKQILFGELFKPEICDSLASVAKAVYKAQSNVCQSHKDGCETDSTVERNNLFIYEKQALEKQALEKQALEKQALVKEKETVLENFILSFEREKKRLPTAEEIQDNNEDIISLHLIQGVLSDIECKNNTNAIYSSAV
jgi:hypothetical protein